VAADAAVETRIQIGWNKFRQLIPLITNKDMSLIVRGRLHSSCVRCSMLHRSETWPIRKENEVDLQRAKMRMVRWMCGIKLRVATILGEKFKNFSRTFKYIFQTYSSNVLLHQSVKSIM